MKDAYNRDIRYLRLSVTDRCNYRCRYCMDEHAPISPRDPASAEELAEIAQACYRLGIDKIRLTGGEPLMRGDIVELCRMIRAISPDIELAMTTNGSMLPIYADKLKAAGLSRLNISLDTLDRERFRSLTRVGELDDVMSGIDAADNAGFSGTKINAVLIGGVNDDEVPAVAALAQTRDVSVRFIELMPMHVVSGWDDSCYISAERVMPLLGELTPVGFDGVTQLYSKDGWRGTVGFITPMSHRFCHRCDRVRVTADCKLKPCLHSNEEIDLKGIKGDKLLETIRTGILQKPLSHHLEDRRTDTSRYMNEIGG